MFLREISLPQYANEIFVNTDNFQLLSASVILMTFIEFYFTLTICVRDSYDKLNKEYDLISKE